MLDDAAIYKARVVQDQRAAWGARGLRRLFLPPYSPKRNKIERRWHRGKHAGLRPEVHGTDHALLERVECIPSRVGTKYAVAFTWLLKSQHAPNGWRFAHPGR